jgi:AcrR family transcriptional regulator
MSAPTRRRLTAEERRAGILDAALAVFSARGYHPSSIDDIAREAGISKALIYEHFESKQGLYADLIERNAAELVKRLAAAIGSVEADSGAVRLATGLDAFFAFVEERRDAWRILFRDSADPETAPVLDRILEQVTGLVAALIAEDPGARAIAEQDADRAIRVLARMLVGSVQSVANWWPEHREVPRDEIVEMVMAYTWLGLDRLSRGERWAPEQ